MKHFHALTMPLHVLRSGSFFLVFGLLFVFLFTVSARADTVSALQEKIEERNSQLQALEAEIAGYEAELTKVGADRKTLEAEIARLDLSRKKIAADIAVTENRIVTADLQLDELDEEIVDKERRINESKTAIQKSLRLIAKIDDVPLVEHFLAGVAFSEAWTEADQLRRVQLVLGDEVIQLEATRLGLEQDYADVSQKQGQLISYQRQLSSQKTVLDQNRQEQTVILGVTKVTELEYQALLDQKREAREQLEAELRDFESQLQYTLDPSKIPSPGSGVLQFPLDPNFMNRCGEREKTFGNLYCITQYFGDTPFARLGAYNGQGHNGMDFGAPSNTPVLAALSGVVQGVGNTDRIVVDSKIRVIYGQINVRSSPNGSILGTQSSGRVGTVLDGPTQAGKYLWWKVNFGQGIDGWVADVAINNLCSSYGKWILVRHANGLSTLYAHLSNIGVSKGEAVTTGEFLGSSGNTGYSTGPHLHFTAYVADEVRIVSLGEVAREKRGSTNCPAAYIPVAPTEAYLNPLNYL